MPTLPPPVPGALAPGPAKPPRNWFQRNLKWALPLGAVVMLGSWALLGWSGYRQLAQSLKGSEPYRQALARASADPQVQAALGQPVEASPWLFGNIGHFPGMSHASMVIRIAGPAGKGRIHVDAYRSSGPWRYDVMAVSLPGRHPRLDLRTAEEQACTRLLGQCE